MDVYNLERPFWSGSWSGPKLPLQNFWPPLQNCWFRPHHLRVNCSWSLPSKMLPDLNEVIFWRAKESSELTDASSNSLDNKPVKISWKDRLNFCSFWLMIESWLPDCESPDWLPVDWWLLFRLNHWEVHWITEKSTKSLKSPLNHWKIH